MSEQQQQQQQQQQKYPEAEEKEPPPLPNNAILERERKLFRLRKASGGTVARGAFGIHMSSSSTTTTTTTTTTTAVAAAAVDKTENDGLNDASDNKVDNEVDSDTDEVDVKTNNDSSPAADNNNNNKNHHNWYLFIEEAIFLHERGLLQVHDETEQIMDSYALYQLLPAHNMPLAVFLVYAHLRQQTFKVVRYSAERRRLIQEREQLEKHQQQSTDQEQQQQQPTEENIKQRRLVPALRQAAAEATAPPLENMAQHLAWDVYAPNVQFHKKDPGLPAFSVLVTPHAVPFSVQRLGRLVQDNDPVPIKIATVADHGTVILFGVTDLGAPSIINTEKG
eukprot:scaffold6456_cov147-Amphora_coffeaeformis.AAC.5